MSFADISFYFKEEDKFNDKTKLTVTKQRKWRFTQELEQTD